MIAAWCNNRFCKRRFHDSFFLAIVQLYIALLSASAVNKAQHIWYSESEEDYVLGMPVFQAAPPPFFVDK